MESTASRPVQSPVLDGRHARSRRGRHAGHWRAAASALHHRIVLVLAPKHSRRSARTIPGTLPSIAPRLAPDRCICSGCWCCGLLGNRRTQAAIASMWNAARRAHGSWLAVPARRNRALALPGVLAAASAVLGACYSARIWHGGVFRLHENSALGTGSLPLRESGAYRSVFVVTSAALLPKESCPSSATGAVFATGSSAAETRRKGRLERPYDKSGTTRT